MIHEILVNYYYYFLYSHYPFLLSEQIMSISTVLKSGETINCNKAFEMGTSLIKHMLGKTFDKLKFERKKRVLSIEATTSLKLTTT